MFAAALASAGVEVRYAVDAAAGALVPECDAVILGADSVGDAGVVNKIGSTALAHAARAAGVPVYVLADETKMLPTGFPQVLDDDRPGDEVWDAPGGVEVWNRYFEVVPMELVAAIATEEGIRTPSEVGRSRAKLDLPAGLRAQADRRQRGEG